jgi:hypothetical protein
VRWRRNQQHSYITLQSTWLELYNGVLASINRSLLHVARLLRIPDILFIQSQKKSKNFRSPRDSIPRGSEPETYIIPKTHCRV